MSNFKVAAQPSNWSRRVGLLEPVKARKGRINIAPGGYKPPHRNISSESWFFKARRVQ
ncbi:hypothetical protein OGM63_06545 [Plectonema radiosum NIES-515]|uniref:Uncharacterized protein n=1 Tax=Plectonema radiosum NIES-515 TaxID=2986073 RepID=A0ABT3AVN6_9CYAN|nr:hypothetical protein [Plectonema radiosum]MCV3213184.1 hypothetical protein [Plectonema radiosum NIES-515]